MPILPPAIAAYFAAQQSDDIAAFEACFAPDAVVHDERRDHRGIAAITAWHIETSTRTPFTARPLSLSESGGKFVVAAEVSGAFPGSPVVLDHLFTLADGRIVALEIH